MVKKLLIIPMFLSACSAGVDLESVDYKTLFTDANSKVWIVNKLIVENADIAPVNNLGKDVVVFHQNGHCDLFPMKELTRKPARKGEFTLNSQERTLRIDFYDKTSWLFDIPYFAEDSILLNAAENSKTPFSMQLKPFPEL